jgi:hypothetical protein
MYTVAVEPSHHLLHEFHHHKNRTHFASAASLSFFNCISLAHPLRRAASYFIGYKEANVKRDEVIGGKYHSRARQFN